jgi:small multidrug resistance family-3 protein
MIRLLQSVPVWLLLVVATTMEAGGDAVCRAALYNHVGPARIALFLTAAALLFGYGLFLNLAPLEFGRVVGMYIAILFLVWQIINFAAFRTAPTLPVAVGGGLIVAGGLIVSFWRPR